jgi:hypothetical protein
MSEETYYVDGPYPVDSQELLEALDRADDRAERIDAAYQRRRAGYAPFVAPEALMTDT